MVFQNYEFISTNGLDHIVIKWKVSDAFLSKSDSKQLFAKGYTIKEKLRKQLPPDQKWINKMKSQFKVPDSVEKKFEALVQHEPSKQHSSWFDSAIFIKAIN